MAINAIVVVDLMITKVTGGIDADGGQASCDRPARPGGDAVEATDGKLLLANGRSRLHWSYLLSKHGNILATTSLPNREL